MDNQLSPLPIQQLRRIASHVNAIGDAWWYALQERRPREEIDVPSAAYHQEAARHARLADAYLATQEESRRSLRP